MKHAAEILIVLTASMPLVSAHAQDASMVRGVVRTAAEASISSDLGARVLRVPFREGQSFNKGDLLIEFDCDKVRAELRSAEADKREHAVVQQNNANLQRYHAVGANELAISRAHVDKATAVVDAWNVRLAQCKVFAPFSGRVAEVGVHEFESPAASVALVRIVDDHNLEVETIVPSKWFPHLKIGDAFGFTVEETGAVIKARIVRTGATVDPVSQTMKVIGVLECSDGSILPGMSGMASFAFMGNRS